MGPRQAWGTFTVLLVLCVMLASAILYDLGYDMLLVVSFSSVFLLVYLYVLYKRYHVEVITENDVMVFDDPDDLRILCGIYGLDSSGEPGALRQRLLMFVRSNEGRPFAWVAPRAVLSMGSALEIQRPQALGPEGAPISTSPLIRSTPRSEARLSSIQNCPVCGAKASRKGRSCRECGADLEFYEVLRGSKLGKMVLSEKSVAVRRKLRYAVTPSGKE